MTIANEVLLLMMNAFSRQRNQSFSQIVSDRRLAMKIGSRGLRRMIAIVDAFDIFEAYLWSTRQRMMSMIAPHCLFV